MLITHDRKGHSARTECTNQHTSADDASPSTPPGHTKCAGDTPDVLIETHEGIVHALRAQEKCTGEYTSHHAMRRVMHVQPGAHEVGSRTAYVTLHTGPRGEDSPACSRPTHVRRAEQPRPPTCEARSGELRFRQTRPGSGHRGIAAPTPLRWARRWHAESLQRRKGVKSKA